MIVTARNSAIQLVSLHRHGHIRYDPQSVAPVDSSNVLPASPPVAMSPSLWKKVAFALAILVIGAALLFISVRQRPVVENGDLHSIAVLPLVAQGSGADYDVADGITDSIINNLSLVPTLRVISHASVFQYRGQTVDPQSVGQKLGVAAVLIGHVEQAGDVLTVNLEVTATSDRRRLWGQQYTRKITDQNALQQEVAGAVADALRLGLTPARRQQIGGQTTSDAEAHQLYLKGRYYFFKETPSDVLRARALFQEAIDHDPMFALAYSALGDTYDWMATEGYQAGRGCASSDCGKVEGERTERFIG
jgi:TolB-like protein